MKCVGALINNVLTDLVISDYENMIFLTITQNQKFGPMILVDKTTTRTWEGEQDVYEMKNLFGREDEWSQALARYLSEHTDPPKPVVYSILIQEDQKNITTMESLKEIINIEKSWGNSMR